MVTISSRPNAIPSAQELERALADDLAWLAEDLGSPLVEVAPVSPLRGRDRPRAAFRLTLADGRRLKLRRMRSPERAEELARLVGLLREVGIPQVVSRRAEALVVEWIEGAPFDDPEGRSERLEEAARLLARIHRTPAAGGLALPVVRSTADEWLVVQEELAALVRAGGLAAETAERLAAAVRERGPTRAACGIVHGDFCAENLVIDGGGRLQVVDNEGIELGPLARDVARAWSRWPLSEPAWARFLAAYREAAGGACAPEAELPIWKLRSLVRSAWYRVTYRLAGVDAALARLRRQLESL